MPNRRVSSKIEWHGWESNPQNHEVLSFAALPDCVPGQMMSVPDRI